MPSIQASRLVQLTSAILTAHGVPRGSASVVAASLVKANLLGHDSHGIMRLPRYLDFISRGKIAPRAKPVIVRRRETIACIDGRWTFGQIGALFSCEVLAQLAARHGVGTVALHNVMHIGRLGEYAENLARQGFAVLVLTSNGGPENAVAPFGGRDRLFGTNPMAFAVPGPRTRALLVVDFATSATAEGKLALAKATGQEIEAGALVDRHGKPSVDPGAFYSGGALLPFGAHKGYGIMVMVEVMARIMSGYVDVNKRSYLRRPGNTTLFVAWAIDRFGTRQHFVHEIGKFIRAVKKSRPAGSCREVLLPGEIEARTARDRRKSGVPVPDVVWNELLALARGN